MSFFNELKRRNVFRVGAAYIVVAWLIIQVVDVVINNIGAPDWVFLVILLLLGIGLPVILLFAWAFELTSEGIKRESEVDRSSSITPVTGKKLEYFTIAALSLVVVFLVAKHYIVAGDPASGQPVTASQETDTETVAKEKDDGRSIAVLPFEDYSENADQGHFSRGIAEEILNLLAKTQGLRVAARTSSFAFAGRDVDIRDIGTKLNVGTVLEGSIRKSGNKIRITAQLIKIEDGYHLWSETYDRDYSDIFAIQDEISASIMSSLKVHLLGEPNRTIEAERTHNMDTYSAYLIGKERLALLGKDNIESAIEKLEESIRIESDFAPAHAALARAWLMLEQEPGGPEKEEVDRVVIPAVESAIALSPNLPEAIAVRGLHHLYRYRYDDARRDFNRTIELNPNYALAYLWRSETFYEQEQFLDMLADKEKAYSLDPMSLEISDQLAYDYGAFWRPRDADRIIARMFELHPHHERAYRALARNLGSHGRYAESALALEEALKHHPDNMIFKVWHAWDLLNMGLYDEVLAQDEDAASFYVYLHQGRYEKARELADSVAANSIYPGWFRYAPKQMLTWEMRDEQGMAPFRSAVAEHLDYLDKEGIPLTDECRLYLLYDMKQAGIDDGVEEMMHKCRSSTEERLKAQYFCPCSWFDLVTFATIDGRIDDAIEHTREWLDNGDSSSLLYMDRVMKEWSDRPEYQEFLARNEEQVNRQQALYRAGVKARDSVPVAEPKSSGP